MNEHLENVEQPEVSRNQKHNLPKVETTPKQSDGDSEERASQEKKAMRQDQAKIAEIRASFDFEMNQKLNNIKEYLQEYLGLKEGGGERIKLLKVKDLPANYQAQREAVRDSRVDDVTIAVIPDDVWVKGSQPSESSADKHLILMKQSYFEKWENPDEIAWLCHELAHCKNFLDSGSPEEYEDNMQKFAFHDLKTESTYPNNPVEQFTFTKQFQFLKRQGRSRSEVLIMLGKFYPDEDFPFFNRLLDGVYN